MFDDVNYQPAKAGWSAARFLVTYLCCCHDVRKIDNIDVIMTSALSFGVVLAKG